MIAHREVSLLTLARRNPSLHISPTVTSAPVQRLGRRQSMYLGLWNQVLRRLTPRSRLNSLPLMLLLERQSAVWIVRYAIVSPLSRVPSSG